MAIDHISIGVTNMAKAKPLYDAIMAALDLEPVMPVEVGGRFVAVGYGVNGKPEFWITLPLNGQAATSGNGVHIAFAAKTREAVDAFFLAALDHGAVEDGRPGLRSEYHPDYYAAFIRDADGNKIEAVCHGK